MFRQAGEVLSRWWFIALFVWFGAYTWLHFKSPPFDTVAKGGEFVFLPDRMESRQAEKLFSEAFPDRKTTSNLVVVVYREEKDGLSDDDKSFVTDKLMPELQKIRDKLNYPVGATNESERKIITDIHDFSERGIGRLLMSRDQQAALIDVDFALDFQDTRNWEPVKEIETVIAKLKSDQALPKGLGIEITGSATLGRDLTQAEEEGARKTGPLTVALVIILLAVIYRAPILALIPLTTLFISVEIAIRLLTVLGQAGYVPLFKGLQQYTTVISYGPGVDYCLFLVARYKENLLACVPPRQALVNAIAQVGPAILASAATVICGIGMMYFAEFGKFHEAGIGIGTTLLIVMFGVLTLTPSLLFPVGHWAFWPKTGTSCVENSQSEPTDSNAAIQTNLFQPLWARMGGVIDRHPIRMLSLTILLMLPFAACGIYCYRNVSYGLLESLPKASASYRGATILERHFAAGVTGPIQVLLQNSKLDFTDEAGIDVIQTLVNNLMAKHAELEIADIRSVANPLGTVAPPENDSAEQSSFQWALQNKDIRRHGIEYYVSAVASLRGQVTELEIISTTNPFALESVHTLDRIIESIEQQLPAEHRADTKVSFLGPSASVRDVNIISQGDQWRIDVLVISSVLLILVLLLRSIVVSVYLLLTVLLSYVATLGMTWLLFYGLDPHGFVGLDWTVPLFLFVVLIAVGEDYNIFLVTRIHEEQRQTGQRQGIVDALAKTGGIITSCGFIMAGTFSSLIPNSLARMQQLGFALAVGVLLDTFVVRPILVPAFLMILGGRRQSRSETSPLAATQTA